MEFFFYLIASYILYGAFLVCRDFGAHWIDAPMYTRKPNAKGIIFALLIRPFSANRADLFLPSPMRTKFFGVIKFLVKLGLIGFVLYFIIGLFS